jgi:hypothetical protein
MGKFKDRAPDTGATQTKAEKPHYEPPKKKDDPITTGRQTVPAVSEQTQAATPAAQTAALMKQSTALTNPFAKIGERAHNKGPLMFYRQGDWYEGKEAIPLGTRLLAIVDRASHGWVRWKNSEIVEERLHLICDDVEAEKREDLGYLDKSEWETDDNGEPQDPWSYRHYLPMRTADHEPITWCFWSDGAMGCWEKLCARYAPFYGSGKYPVVELGTDTYFNKRFRKDTDFPVLKIVRWLSYGTEAAGEVEIIPPAGTNGGSSTAQLPKRDAEMDDSIPF